jgi:hypothetical protein
MTKFSFFDGILGTAHLRLVIIMLFYHAAIQITTANLPP